MKSHEIARRYAKALYRLAREEGRVEEIAREYRTILADVDGIPDFISFLSHPLVPREAKLGLVDRAFPAIANELRNLFRVLIRNGREGYLDLIWEEFLAVRAAEERAIRVGVVAAQRLPEAERSRLIDRVGRALGGRVELEERIEPDLIGGARIEIGGKVIDGTLRAKLAELAAFLAG